MQENCLQFSDSSDLPGVSVKAKPLRHNKTNKSTEKLFKVWQFHRTPK